MTLKDNEWLREALKSLYPNIIIDGVPAPSGQRVVFFCHFGQSEEVENNWHEWGEVVLKVTEGNAVQTIAYIQREIEILKELNNPGYPDLYFDEAISTLPDSDTDLKYVLFITIEEKIDSTPLSDLVNQYNSEDKVSALLLDLIHVLRPLWERTPSLIHRDLKPQNILITPEGNVVIIDLGIVRIEGVDGDTMTAANWGPCTPKYASPEQATNDKKNITFKSDIFTLGILCYELLTGSNPFETEGVLVDEILDRVVNQTLEPLKSLGASSEKLSDVISKMTHKEPFRRYRKIDNLVYELGVSQGDNHGD